MINPCAAAAMKASRVERDRSCGSGGSWSDGLTRCQISVKIFPARRPPATLLMMDRGLYNALAALTALKFPRARSLNVRLEHVLAWSRAIHLRRGNDGPDVLP